MNYVIECYLYLFIVYVFYTNIFKANMKRGKKGWHNK